MAAEYELDRELAARLKRLAAQATEAAPAFDYHGLLTRHAVRQERARRRMHALRASAGALVVALVGLSVWRLDPRESRAPVAALTPPAAAPAAATQPRIVRADTHIAVAALEDHIATLDEALSAARLARADGAEVARLERTRAELLDSYTRVRYAELLSANL